MARHESGVVQVFVFKNGEFYGSDCFAQAEIRIGRGEEADLKLDADEVSRDHAVLRVEDEGLTIEDLGSVNGTQVNGEAVERVFIRQWDEVQIGEFTFKAKLIGKKKKRPPVREVTEVTRAKGEDAEPTLVEPPPVAAEEDEDLENFVEPFSLLSNLVRESFKNPQVTTEADPVIEVIRYSPERQVRAFDQVTFGKRYKVGPQKFPLLRFHDRYSCKLMFTSDFSGGVIRGNRTVSLEELKTTKNLHSKRRGTKVYSVTMMKGDYANLNHQGSGAFVRFVHPPTIPRAKRKLELDKTKLKILGSTFAFHLVFIALLGFLSPKVEAAVDRDIDKFAKVDLQDIPMNKPEDEPEYPVYQKPEPEKEKPQPVDEKPLKTNKKPSKAVKKGGGGKSKSKGGGGGGGEGMMAALGQLGKKKAVAMDTTNIDAHRVPKGARYMVSGMVVKSPKREVMVSRGRGLGVRGGIDLLGGGKKRGGKPGFGPGELTGGETGTRTIGAVVFEPPKRKIKKKGHLTREEIARVVKQHLREIQYCYEKNLLRNNKLKGKMIMEWTIVSTGRVSLVKTRFNSMRSSKVARCVSKSIKKMQFPRPRGGGLVEVEYPFLFEQVGFE